MLKNLFKLLSCSFILVSSFALFSIASAQTLHPSDTSLNWNIDINEMTGYGSCWKTNCIWQNPPNPVPIDYVTNAGLLWKQGGNYHYDVSSTPPWRSGVLFASNWIRGYGGQLGDSAVAVDSDENGNIVVAGTFSGASNFGGQNLTSAGSSDILIAKYTNSGSHLWSIRYGSTGDERVKGIALDNFGNIYIVGHFTGVTNLGGNTFSSVGQNDMFLAKYSPEGSYLWSKVFGGSRIDMFSGLVVDSESNVVVAGTYQLSINLGNTTFSNLGYSNLVLAKYSSNGEHVYSKTFSSGNNNYVNGIAIDQNSNVFLTGSFFSWIDFGGGRLTSVNNLYEDFYIAKLDRTGAHVWSNRYGGTSSDKGNAITVDQNGDAIVGGTFFRHTELGGVTITGQAYDQDMFLAKYSGANGAHIWSKSIIGDYGISVNALKSDAQSNIFVTGYYYGTFNFGSRTLTSMTSNYDGFNSKYSSVGTELWSESFGGSGIDGSSAITVDFNNYLVIVGVFSGTTNFGDVTLISHGSTDLFIMKRAP